MRRNDRPGTGKGLTPPGIAALKVGTVIANETDEASGFPL
jgi:hypothetical protein